MLRIFFTCLFLLLAACGDSASNQTGTDDKTGLEETLTPQLDALEKAKEVEDTLQQSFEERDKQMRDKGI